MDKTVSAFVLAGTNSGVGKTTVTLGLLRALSSKGKSVQGFKVGPDYIDPAFHFFASGRKSKNLDAFLVEESGVDYLFRDALENAEVGVVEGVMGLFDGQAGTDGHASTAHVSKILGLPVILIVDGSGSHTSVAAVVKGFECFDAAVKLQGVIVNKVSTERHYTLIKDAIERNTGVKCYGWMGRSKGIQLSSRHLGLVPAEELTDLDRQIDDMAALLTSTVDVDAILVDTRYVMNDTWRSEPDFKPYECARRPMGTGDAAADGPLRLGVANDKAFSFYYDDNLALLAHKGIELVPFSPMSDRALPERLDGMYFGGGFPEVFASELEENDGMRQSVREAASKGMPIFAECGGLMYLTEKIIGFDGVSHSMTGVLPLQTKMTGKLQRFGYVDVMLTGDTILGRKGTRFKAHEFHRSVIEGECQTRYEVSKSRNGVVESWPCGFVDGHVLAGYAHIHFYGCLECVDAWIGELMDYRVRCVGK